MLTYSIRSSRRYLSPLIPLLPLKCALFFVWWFLEHIFGMVITSPYHLVHSHRQKCSKKWAHNINPDVS